MFSVWRFRQRRLSEAFIFAKTTRELEQGKKFLKGVGTGILFMATAIDDLHSQTTYPKSSKVTTMKENTPRMYARLIGVATCALISFVSAHSASAKTVEQVLRDNPGVVYNKNTHKFYKYINRTEIWLDAQRKVNQVELSQFPGRLVQIESANENEFVRKLAYSRGERESIWIGGSDVAEEGTWIWMTSGVQFSDSKGRSVNGQYENWRHGEPNNGNAGKSDAWGDADGEDYLRMIVSTGQWTDRSTYQKFRHVVEWDADVILGQAKNYYVRRNGSDRNDGLSPQTAFRTIRRASQIARPGSTIYVGAGNYSQELKSVRSGVPSRPIRFVADSSGAKTGDAGDATISSEVEIEGRRSIHFIGFRFNHKKVKVEKSSNIVFDQCKFIGLEELELKESIVTVRRSIIRDGRKEGIEIEKAQATIVNCLVVGCRDNGIEAKGDRGRLSVLHCTIAYNGDDGIDVDDTDKWRVGNCIIAFNGDNGLDGENRPTHGNNLFYKNRRGDFNGGVRKHESEIVEDPEFVSRSDFRLRPTSPAIDVGKEVGVSIDLIGNARPEGEGHDLGCFEAVDMPKEYYVSTRGNDKNDGLSRRTPFRTIQKACTVVNPGDTVYVGGGEYVEHVFMTTAGKQDARITFIADTTGAKTGRRGEVHVRTANRAHGAFALTNAPYVTIEGFRFTSCYDAVGATRSEGLIVRNCIFEKNTVGGLKIVDGSATVIGCTFRDQQFGLSCSKADLTVEDCKFNHNTHTALFFTNKKEQVKLTVKDSYFMQNTYGAYAIGDMLLDNCKFEKSGNSWSILSINGDLEVKNMQKRLTGNQGSGLYIWDDRDPSKARVIRGWTLTDNYGALALGGGKFRVENCTIRGNKGWAVQSYWADVTMVNSPVKENRHGLYVYAPPSDKYSRPLRLSGFEIEECGQGIYVYGGTLRFDNTTVTKTKTYQPLAVAGADITFADSQIHDNYWGIFVGGRADGQWPHKTTIRGLDLRNTKRHPVWSMNGDLTLVDCKISGKSEWFGILHHHGNLTLDRCQVEDMSHSSVYLYNKKNIGNKLVIRNSDISNNQHSAITAYGVDLHLENTTIDNNKGGWAITSTNGDIKLKKQPRALSNNGGGLAVYDNRKRDTPRVIRDWRLTGNGSALRLGGGRFRVQNCTIENNRHWGLQMYRADVTMVDSPLLNNGYGLYVSDTGMKKDTHQNVVRGLHVENVDHWGMYVWGSKLRLEESKITGSKNWGFHAYRSELDFVNSVVENNALGAYITAGEYHGRDRDMILRGMVLRNSKRHPVWAYHGDITLKDCEVSGRSEWMGINHNFGNLTLDNCVVRDMHHTAVSTGHHSKPDLVTLTVRNSDISNNNGTAIQSGNADLVVENTTIKNNAWWGVFSQNGDITLINQPKSITGNGGGLGIRDTRERSEPRLVKDWKLTGNKNGLYLAGGKFRVENCTIRNNSGWALRVGHADVTMVNSPLSHSSYGAYVQVDWAAYKKNTKETILRGLDIHDIEGTGIQVWGSKVKFEDCSVRRTTLKVEDWNFALNAWRSELTFINSTFEDNGRGAVVGGSNYHNFDRPMTLTGAAFLNTDTEPMRGWFGDLTLKDCKFIGSKKHGVNHWYGSNMTVENCRIEGMAGGYALSHGAHVANSRFLVKDTVIVNNKHNGLYGGECPMTVDNCQIEGNGGYAMMLRNCDLELKDQPKEISNSGAGLWVYDNRQQDAPRVISDWKFNNITGTGLSVGAGKYLVQDITLTNTGYGISSSGIKSLDIQRVYSRGRSDVNGWGLSFHEPYGKTTVKNSVFANHYGGARLYFWTNNSNQLHLYNSTFANNRHYGVRVEGGNTAIANCIFTGVGSQGYGLYRTTNRVPLTHSHNLVYSFGASYYNTQGSESDNVFNNPRFVDAANGNFQLGKGSPAINAGTNLALVSRDYFRNPRPSFKVHEIGAYEYMNKSGSFRVLDWQEKK